MNLAPVALFTYNRIAHFSKVIDNLIHDPLAKDTHLFIFIDGAKNQQDQQKINDIYVKSNKILGFRQISITVNNRNIGLANSIISGVSTVLSKYSNVIVLEDDLITANNFLYYMNKALKFYKPINNVFSITGYSFPLKITNKKYDTYYFERGSSWGWATWKETWEGFIKFYKIKNQIEVDYTLIEGGKDIVQYIEYERRGDIDSWATYWCYYHLINKSYCIYPIKNYIKNIGFDNSGTNCSDNKKYYNEIGIKQEKEFTFADKYNKKNSLKIRRFINDEKFLIIKVFYVFKKNFKKIIKLFIF